MLRESLEFSMALASGYNILTSGHAGFTEHLPLVLQIFSDICTPEGREAHFSSVYQMDDENIHHEHDSEPYREACYWIIYVL